MAQVKERGVGGEERKVFFLPFPLPLFLFFRSRFISRAVKTESPFLGISLLRNQTETLATQASFFVHFFAVTARLWRENPWQNFVSLSGLDCAPLYFSLQSYRTRNLSTRAAKPLCRKKRGKELTPYYWTVWSNCSQTNLDELFKLQKRCARLILDILRDARSYDNFQKLKWLPLDQLFKLNKLGLLTKVINWW